MKAAVLAFLAVVSLLACASASASESATKAAADSLARLHDWTGSWLEAGRFSLLTYAPRQWRGTGELTVYIEGDGRSWISREELADDPTPRNGRVLKLAVSDPGDAAYLARPCHYLGAAELAGCHQRYWSLARYGEDVVEAIDAALDTLKHRAGAGRLRLVGYSGGAQLAVLAAARRNDIAGIITVGGNLDHRRWTASQDVSALTGSLNAADVADAVQHIPQVHFLGELDTTVGRDVIDSYLDRMPVTSPGRVIEVPGYDHGCCWADNWPGLLAVATKLLGIPRR